MKPFIKTDKPEPGGLFTNAQIAEILGLPSTMPLKEFQNAGIVYFRERSGTEAYRSARGDVAALDMLLRLRAMARVDFEVLRAASVAFYGWSTPEQEPLPWYPGLHALYAAANSPSEMWMLRLRFLRNDQTDARRIVGYCYAESNPPRIPQDPRDPWQPEADWHVLLTPALVRLVGAFRRFAGRRLDA